MRIAFFNLNRLSFEGGAENYIAEVGTAFALKGHEVYYVGDFRSILKLFPLIGVILGINSYKNARKSQKELDKLPSMRKNTELIKKTELNLRCLIPITKEKKYINDIFDSCHVIFVKNEIIDMFFFFLLGRKFSSKANLIVFTALYYPHQDGLRAKVHNFFYTGFFYKWFLRMYSGVVVSNKFELNLIPQEFRYPTERVHYVPYGIRKDEFKLLKTEQSDNKFRILFVGRMETQKGVDHLITLIKMLSQRMEFQQMELSIAGSGPQENKAEELSKQYKNVHYLGLVPKEDINKLYNAHDVVIIPSIWETFSYVCLEAQSCGIPVIAFDIPGPNDIVVNEITGRLVPLGDIEKFEKDILDLFFMKKNNFCKFFQMKEMAQNHIFKNFPIEVVVHNLELVTHYEVKNEK